MAAFQAFLDATEVQAWLAQPPTQEQAQMLELASCQLAAPYSDLRSAQDAPERATRLQATSEGVPSAANAQLN